MCCVQGIVPGSRVTVWRVKRVVSERMVVYCEGVEGACVTPSPSPCCPLCPVTLPRPHALPTTTPSPFAAARTLQSRQGVVDTRIIRVLGRVTAVPWAHLAWLCPVCGGGLRRAQAVGVCEEWEGEAGPPLGPGVYALPCGGVWMTCDAGCESEEAPTWLADVICVFDDGTAEVRGAL